MLNKQALRQELTTQIEAIKKAAKFDMDMSLLQDNGKLESAINKVAKAKLAELIMNEHSRYVDEQVKISQASNIVNDSIKKQAVGGMIAKELWPKLFGSRGYKEALDAMREELTAGGVIKQPLSGRDIYKDLGTKIKSPIDGKAMDVPPVNIFDAASSNSFTPEEIMHYINNPINPKERFDKELKDYINPILAARGIHAGNPLASAAATGLDYATTAALPFAAYHFMPQSWKDTIMREGGAALTPTADLTNKYPENEPNYAKAMGLGALGGVGSLELASLLANQKLETNPMKMLGWGAAGAGLGGAYDAYSHGMTAPMKEASVQPDLFNELLKRIVG